MEAEAKHIEKEAYQLLTEEKFTEAFRLFRRAAETYRTEHNHKQAALMFASAASCWGLKTGERVVHQAALAYKDAAWEAEKASDFEYASLLYQYAATNFEKDLEFEHLSECSYRSKECQRAFLLLGLIQPRKIHRISGQKEEKGVVGVIKRFLLWVMLTFSFLLWGHGERPLRTFFYGLTLIAICALAFSQTTLLSNGAPLRPNFFQALYLSVITFTTVGYGDITPLGFAKAVAMFEALNGLFIIPILVTGLSRKYLRI